MQIISSAVALLVCALFMAPAAVLWQTGKPGRGVIIAAFAVIVLGLLQTGWVVHGSLSPAPTPKVVSVQKQSAECVRVRELLTQGGVAIGPMDGSTVTVDGAKWGQLPPEVQKVVAACLGDGTGDSGVTIEKR